MKTSERNEATEGLLHTLVDKWQKQMNLLAEIMNVPAALIMRTENEFMEVFVASNSTDNPYNKGDREKWHGLYCETVIKTQEKLLIPNALKDENWNKNPDIELGMISYLGLPINYPDNKPFGTICVLDSKENSFSSRYEELLIQYKDTIEQDLILIQASGIPEEKLYYYNLSLKNKLLAQENKKEG